MTTPDKAELISKAAATLRELAEWHDQCRSMGDAVGGDWYTSELTRELEEIGRQLGPGWVQPVETEQPRVAQVRLFDLLDDVAARVSEVEEEG